MKDRLPSEASTEPSFPRSVRILTLVALALAAVYALAFLGIAVLRMGHPFELEWMEGGSIDNVVRVLDGQSLYVGPSLKFIPFIYPPLYFWIGALAMKLLGGTFLPLRLVSFLAALGCGALIGAIVRQGSRRWTPALLAMGLFAATFREGGAWYDVARVDSLFLLFLLGAYWALRREPATQLHAALAAVLLALACFTKQTGLFIAPAFALAMLIADLRRVPVFLGVLALVLGGGTWLLDRATQHWYWFYVFDLPRDHPIIPQLLRGFWIQDLIGPVGLALAIGVFHFFGNARRERARRLWLDGLVLAAMILAAYLTRIRVGSFDNVVIPAYAAASLLLGLGLDALLARAAEAPAPLRDTLARFALVLVLFQFAVLAYKPWEQIPSREDVQAGRQVVESLRRVEGEVWVPSHGYLAVMAGKPRYAHELAMVDVMRPGETPQRIKIRDEMRAAIRDKRFGVIVLDHEGWLKTEVEPSYKLYARMFAENEKKLFWPKTGYVTRPEFVWVPKP